MKFQEKFNEISGKNLNLMKFQEIFKFNEISSQNFIQNFKTKLNFI